MVKELPPGPLLLADGNFVGYDIWQALGKRNREFLIRVGGNVLLLWKLWPEAAEIATGKRQRTAIGLQPTLAIGCLSSRR